MTKKTKNQHYVPQGYLKAWDINGNNQVYVYDKELRKAFLTNHSNIASKRYFYDLDWSYFLTPDVCERLGITQEIIHELNEEQSIEKFFAEKVEGEFERILNRIIKRISELNSDEMICCQFISKEEKYNLSNHLTMQFLRVAAFRSSVENNNNQMVKLLHDLEVPQEIIDKNTIQKNELSAVHTDIMFSEENDEIVEGLYFKKWLLLVNRTKQPFFTSDNPIRTIPHLKDPIIPMNGLKSPGVEVIFPISPDLLLTMFDDKNIDILGRDLDIVEIHNKRIVQRYNSYCVAGCNSIIISNTDDFSLVDDLLTKE